MAVWVSCVKTALVAASLVSVGTWPLQTPPPLGLQWSFPPPPPHTHIHTHAHVSVVHMCKILTLQPLMLMLSQSHLLLGSHPPPLLSSSILLLFLLAEWLQCGIQHCSLWLLWVWPASSHQAKASRYLATNHLNNLNNWLLWWYVVLVRQV